MDDPAHEIYESDPRSLAHVLDLVQGSGKESDPEVLAAVLDDELTRPVQFELSAVGPALAGAARIAASSQGLLVKSLGDLLQHPHPPLELLVLAKAYARSNLQHPDSALPRDVALVLYFACIAAAMVRCGRRITQLGTESLSAGLAWAAGQAWVAEETRDLLQDAGTSLTRESGA